MLIVRNYLMFQKHLMSLSNKQRLLVLILEEFGCSFSTDVVRQALTEPISRPVAATNQSMLFINFCWEEKDHFNRFNKQFCQNRDAILASTPDTFLAHCCAKYFNSYIMPAPAAMCFHRGGRLLKVFLFISPSVLLLARDWDGPNKVPSKSWEGFDESTSSSSWISRAVAFACSKEDKVLP